MGPVSGLSSAGNEVKQTISWELRCTKEIKEPLVISVPSVAALIHVRATSAVGHFTLPQPFMNAIEKRITHPVVIFIIMSN